MSLILAADIGGTNIRAAVIDEAGNMLREQRSQIDLGDRKMSTDQMITRLTDYFSNVLKTNPDICSIGAGFPGFFLGDSGVLVASPNLPNLKNVPLAQRLSEALNIPVSIQNDALCAAMGEHSFGAGKGSNNLLHITLGTGIGGGLILNNQPYTGESGMAMEFGHLRVAYDENARLCGCSGKGCVEAYASATAIVSRYEEATGEQCSAKTIFERAENHDKEAQNIIESAAINLGSAIVEAIKLLDIHTVTISGGLIGAWPQLHPHIMASLNANLISPQQGMVTVSPSTLGDNAGILGAAALSRNITISPSPKTTIR